MSPAVRAHVTIISLLLASTGCYGKTTVLEQEMPSHGDDPGDPKPPGPPPSDNDGLCGSRTCEEDEECVLGHCVARCANERCMDTLQCCPDEKPACVFDRYCRAPCPYGPPCGARGDICCGAGEVCGETGTCIADCAPGHALCGNGRPGSFGSTCCPAGAVCVFDECRTPGAVCESFVDCDLGEYCERVLVPPRCMPNRFPADVPACQLPASNVFQPEVEWHWLGTRADGSACSSYGATDCYRNVMVTPFVADLDRVEDPQRTWVSPMTGRSVTFAAGKHPEVVFKAYPLDRTSDEVIVVLDGRTGETKAVIPGSGPHGHVAVGNLDRDDKLEIVHARDPGVAAVDPFYDPSSTETKVEWTQDAGDLNRSFAGGAPTLTDLNNDGQAEVVMGGVVLDGKTGAVLADFGPAYQGGGPDADFDQSWYIAAVADVDLDGRPEVLTGRRAIEVSARCDWLGCGSGQHCEDRRCVPNSGEKTWSWKVDWTWPLPYPLERSDSGTGFPGVANFVDNMLPPYNELDDPPEVVVVLDGRVAFLNGRDGTLMTGLDGVTPLFFTLFDWRGGAPNIADFDGDGRPEVGFAGRGCMVVVDVDCAVADAETRAAQPPGCATDPAAIAPCTQNLHPDTSVAQISQMLGILWMDATQDESSAATGTSVFDFQGDGAAEVLYNDECFLRVYDGSDGTITLERPSSSRTGSEYPVVVDVDGDRNSEIVWASNNDQASEERDRCASRTGDSRMAYWQDHDLYRAALFCNEGSDPSGRPDDRYDICRQGTWGVWAFGDPRDQWVQTQPYWHQHTFHITEIDANGQPLADWGSRPASWELFNSYRQNVQGDAPLNAPDLVIESLTAGVARCPPVVRLVAHVVNRGHAGIPAGVPVVFYFLSGATPDAPIATLVLPRALLPGEAVDLGIDHVVREEGRYSYRAVVNPDAATLPPGPTWECDPENNSADADAVCERVVN